MPTSMYTAASKGKTNDDIERLRAENEKMRSALEKVWPYFRYMGGMPVFSPSDYAFIRRTLREALGMEEE